MAPDWKGGCGLTRLLERFTGSERWDDPELLMAAYERHNAQVREAIPRRRLLEWRAADGWGPLCRAFRTPIPDDPFPWLNKRSDWG